ncbi:MAG TPA: site-2 protease family protein [Flexivirga sp.]|uniref:site-2 protease family protein n=1 Tax=Flexivirga sp. TaxID=1962927 RepID=UPI002D15372B|nr:site-2 protease family protein [Flexivirga sp.]HWC22395.1 site-2 protease family protein [Flexivirga sp.]
MANADRPGWQLGTLRGVPVYIGRTWPIIAVVVIATFGPQVADAYPDLGAGAYIVAFIYTLLLLLSVVAHEAAHALVGQWRGYHVRRIVADLWGGHTAYDTDDSSPMSSALVAVVGPLANAVLALAGWLALHAVADDREVARLLIGAVVFTNGFVAIFNLLPGMPLDGGFILDAVVWRLTGSRSAGLLVAGWCGRVVAVGFVGWTVVRPLVRGETPQTFYVLWSVLIAGFLWVGAGNAIARARAGRLFARVRVRDVLRPAAIAPDTALAAQLPQATDVVVVDQRGVPWGVIAPAELQRAAGPGLQEVRAAALARVQPAGWVAEVPSVDVDVTALVRAAQDVGGAIQELLVVVDGQPAGLVAIQALGDALAAAERPTSAPV